MDASLLTFIKNTEQKSKKTAWQSEHNYKIFMAMMCSLLQKDEKLDNTICREIVERVRTIVSDYQLYQFSQKVPNTIMQHARPRQVLAILLCALETKLEMEEEGITSEEMDDMVGVTLPIDINEMQLKLANVQDVDDILQFYKTCRHVISWLAQQADVQVRNIKSKPRRMLLRCMVAVYIQLTYLIKSFKRNPRGKLICHPLDDEEECETLGEKIVEKLGMFKFSTCNVFISNYIVQYAPTTIGLPFEHVIGQTEYMETHEYPASKRTFPSFIHQRRAKDHRECCDKHKEILYTKPSDIVSEKFFDRDGFDENDRVLSKLYLVSYHMKTKVGYSLLDSHWKFASTLDMDYDTKLPRTFVVQFSRTNALLIHGDESYMCTDGDLWTLLMKWFLCIKRDKELGLAVDPRILNYIDGNYL